MCLTVTTRVTRLIPGVSSLPSGTAWSTGTMTRARAGGRSLAWSPCMKNSCAACLIKRCATIHHKPFVLSCMTNCCAACLIKRCAAIHHKLFVLSCMTNCCAAFLMERYAIIHCKLLCVVRVGPLVCTRVCDGCMVRQHVAKDDSLLQRLSHERACSCASCSFDVNKTDHLFALSEM